MADQNDWSAQRWAIELSKLWRSVAGPARFPVDVEAIAPDLSAARFPSDPIRAIKGGALPDFEGALYPLGNPATGWAIIYNESGTSLGRKRFTISHELGHYLLHRANLPNGIECDERVVTRREGKGIEREADEFAAGLLMPLDDFRARIGPEDKPSMGDLAGVKERYGVSLTAAALRWLEYTNRRAIFVVSRDGGAKWARSSQPAFKTGRFLRTATETFMLPEASLAAQRNFDAEGKTTGVLPAGVWFPEEVEETSLFAKKYDLTLTLLHLPKEVSGPRWFPDAEDEPDTLDKMADRQDCNK
jgi:Zn-dependent peptidase ImmA (M78 family)